MSRFTNGKTLNQDDVDRVTDLLVFSGAAGLTMGEIYDKTGFTLTKVNDILCSYGPIRLRHRKEKGTGHKSRLTVTKYFLKEFASGE